MPILFHPLAESLHRGFELRRAALQLLLGSESLGVLLVGGDVLALFGERKIAVNRHEDVCA
jgi:hypothetical protein